MLSPSRPARGGAGLRYWRSGMGPWRCHNAILRLAVLAQSAGLAQSRTVLNRWISLCLHWDALRTATMFRTVLRNAEDLRTGAPDPPRGVGLLRYYRWPRTAR